MPLSITMPQAPGDAPQSVQFTTSNGLVSSVPVARRTLIPSASGSSFSATLTSSVSRGAGQIKTFFVRVPRGLNDPRRVSGGNVATPEERAPGATGTLTATLTPTAAAGTAVHGTLSVVDSADFSATEPAVGFPLFSDFHDFAYAYTVGS